MPTNRFMHGLGWLPDYPDFRDYTPEHKKIQSILKPTNVLKAARPRLPASEDLRKWCSPVEDQENLGSCTAQAGVGLMEYYERRAFKNHLDASRLFLYKATRNLLGLTGDTGAFLRTTMGAMALFGVPPEKYWPYVIADYDVEPTAFCYSFAKNFEALRYYRLDSPGMPKKTLLSRVKLFLAAGLPSMFGFTVYSSIVQANDDGKIPYPTAGEKIWGGHAIVAVGYNDKMKIKNSNPGGTPTTGALLIRNSWGTGWGDKGYGWLPYEYVLTGLADDWWSLLKLEWIETKVFGI